MACHAHVFAEDEDVTLQGIVAIAAGGALGALARYGVGTWLAARWGGTFPWGTLLINVTGSLLLGLFSAWYVRRAGLPLELRLFVAVGFCGAYTTFSTFALDTVTLAQAAQVSASLTNALLTNALCLSAALVGVYLGGRL
jgi:CrcB protein